MSSQAIAVSRGARLLLELAAASTDVKVGFGGRGVLLALGGVVQVTRAKGDLSLLSFLAAAGRISERDRDAIAAQTGDDEHAMALRLASSGALGPSELVEGRRALLLDRLVRAFASEQGEPTREALAVHPVSTAFETVPLVLDALARHAARGAAERIGGRQDARVQWLDSPARERAVHWSELGEVPDGCLLGSLFPRHPAAAARLAALVRAGVLRLDLPRRANTDPGRPRVGSAPTLPRVEAGKPKPPSQRAPAPRPTGPLGIAPLAAWLPRAEARLADPLTQLERAVDDAPDRTDARADAWLALSAGTLDHQRSPLEAARAAREAVAANPSRVDALARAAALTSACGRPDLAAAYAHTLAERTPAGEARARVLRRLAQYEQRAGRSDRAEHALERALEETPDDWTLHAQLARLLARRGDPQAAAERAVEGARRARVPAPRQSCALLEWAAERAPHDLRCWNELAKSLAHQGHPAAASAILVHASRAQPDLAVRTRLRQAARGFAELSGSALDGELALEALDPRSVTPDPRGHLPEPLERHLVQTGAWAELAVITQELAVHATGAARAGLLLQAARAYEQLPEGAPRALERLCDALVLDPPRAYDALSALAGAEARDDALCDALERALRLRLPSEPEALRALASAERAQLGWLLERLGAQPFEVLGAPRARWVLALREALDGRPPSRAEAELVGEHCATFDALASQLEHALRDAPKAQRSAPGLRLAALYARDPSRRATARRLYEKVLEREPARADIHEALVRLAWLAGDAASLRALRVRQITALPQAASQLELAYAELRAHRVADAQAACHAALARPGKSLREAQVLRWRLALLARDDAQVIDALAALAAHADTPAEQSRMLLRVARAERAAGRHEAALHAVEEALERDPQAAEAGLWLREESVNLPPKSRVKALRRALFALGDSPAVLRELARACYAADDALGQLAALEALRALAPEDPFAARALLALRTTGTDAPELAEALRCALSPACFEPANLRVIEPALARLVTLAGSDRALNVVIAALEALGEQVRGLLPVARALCDAKTDPALVTEIDELALAHAPAEEQPERLRLLATRWRERGSYWAEARTQLRLLGQAPEDPRALERLIAIYAETGEDARLDAALSVAHDLASHQEVRRERLFERAQVAALRGNDPSRAAELIAQAFGALGPVVELPPPPVESLRRGVGLLCTLAPAHAVGLLLALAERSADALARALCEEALLLAEHALSRPDLALDVAVEGLVRHPEHEPFVDALERLTRASGALERLVATLERAADRAREPARQAELFARAAQLAETALDDPGRACLALDQAYRARPTRALEQQLIGAAGRLYTRDLHAGKRVYDRLRDALHVRAKFGPPLARCDALLTLARLAVEVYLAPADSQRYAEAAESALSSAQDALPEEREAAREALAALHSRLSRESMRVAAPTRPREEEQTGVVPSPSQRPRGRASSLPPSPRLRPAPLPSFEAAPRASLPNVEIRRQGGAVASIAPEPERAVVGAEPARDIAPDALAGAVPANDEGSEVRALASEPRDAEAERLAKRLIDGDASALAQVSELLLQQPDRASALCATWLAEARARRFSTALLRALRAASASAGLHALWRTSSQALALFEPALRPPPAPRRRDAQSAPAVAALTAARASDLEPAFVLLAQVVESAAPLFRGGKLRLPRDLAPLREPPYPQLLSELASLFEVRHEAYRGLPGEDRVAITSAHPASILIGERTPPDAAALRFRLARAFELGRPDNVLLAILDPTQCETLFTALSAAFAPAGSGQSVPRAAAGVAAELWNTVPTAGQRKLARLLAALPNPLDHDATRATVQLRGARVGLFTTRALDVALAQLGRDGDPESARIAASAAGLDRALADEPLVRGLFAYAFGDAYLAAVSD